MTLSSLASPFSAGLRSGSPAAILLSALLAGCGSPVPSSDAGPRDADAPEAQVLADASPSVDAGPALPTVEWGECPSRFRDDCATVAMPLDHANPEGETIDVFLSRRGEGTRQLWLLQGGPGASAEAFFGLHDFLANVDPELEVYTIEHRGVGSSTRLTCPTSERAASPEGFQIATSEWAACQAEVVAEWGDRLSYFTTSQAAEDLALAIRATRREGGPVYVYGGSYGTYWANRFGVLHPDLAAGLILDAPVQPGSDLHLWDLQFEPIGRQVFGELCAATPRCREHLGEEPLVMLDRVVEALRGGHCGSLGVDFDTWRAVFSLSLMDYNLRNWLPALVYRLDRCSTGDQAAIAHLFGALFGGGGGGRPRMSRVLQAHVVLAEHWPAGHADETPLVAARMSNTFFQDGVAHAYTVQDTWPRYTPGEIASRYVPTTLPVLVMAGALDPSAPPSRTGYGFRDHLTGPAQTFVEIPYGAHTVLTAAGSLGPTEPSCPVQLVRAFLADPTSALPVECASRVLAPSFDAPPDALTRYWGTEDLYD